MMVHRCRLEIGDAPIRREGIGGEGDAMRTGKYHGVTASLAMFLASMDHGDPASALEKPGRQARWQATTLLILYLQLATIGFLLYINKNK